MAALIIAVAALLPALVAGRSLQIQQSDECSPCMSPCRRVASLNNIASPCGMCVCPKPQPSDLCPPCRFPCIKRTSGRLGIESNSIQHEIMSPKAVCPQCICPFAPAVPQKIDFPTGEESDFPLYPGPVQAPSGPTQRGSCPPELPCPGNCPVGIDMNGCSVCGCPAQARPHPFHRVDNGFAIVG